MSVKKHKKHRADKREMPDLTEHGLLDKPPALKLILKVGGNLSTPEHSNDSSGPGISSVPAAAGHEDEAASQTSVSADSHLEKHKKMKKKKKKKEKDKDKSKEKHDKKHKHRHKDKRKRTHEEAIVASAPQLESSTSEPPQKKAAVEAPPAPPKPRQDTLKPLSPSKGSMSPRSIEAREREQRSCVVRMKMEQSPFSKFLDYLLKQLEKKDPKQFFAWPVTDNFAPGYSNIISNPMDFSTIKQKIDEHTYKNLQEFSDDFKLMCNNAMTYNHQDTIYYKAARKLLHYGVKILAQDKVITLRNILPVMEEVSSEQLGFEMPKEEEDLSCNELLETIEEKPVVPEKPPEPRKPKEMPKSKFEAISDNLTPEEILRDVQNAARTAAKKLTTKHCGQLGFLRQKKDGTTTLNIIVPGDGSIPGTNERPVALGALIGKLPHGTGQLNSFKEDRRNMAKAVKPLNYGPFGSYAPSYDSTFANLTKEESDLVYQTYGDETSVQYAESILDFAKNCDYALTMADNLLDLMTNGDHRRTKKVLEEKKRLKEEEERIRQLTEPPPAPPAPPPLPAHIDFNALRSLKNVGIDVAFLETMEKDVRKKEQIATAHEAMQARLDNTSALIQKLEMVQSERLSQEPPPHLSHIPGPSSAELNLAALVTDSLVDISARLPPEAVASLPGVRKALGVAAIVQEPPVPDLESELREFLESQSALAVGDDKTIEEILSES